MNHPARKPSVAVLLSLVVPGLGHIYLGRIVVALGLLVGHVVFGALAVMVVVVGPSSLGAVPAASAPWVMLWMVASIDAYRSARTLSGTVELREYQRVTIYMLVGLLALPNAVGWALAIRAQVVELFVIPSGSMLPGIIPGSRVLVNKVVYRHSALSRGDRVVFVNPNARHLKHIKRVVALPGDVVSMTNDELSVNGHRFEYADIKPTLDRGVVRIENNGETSYPIQLGPVDPSHLAASSWGPERVPNGYCFALGDNRHRSDDSRVYGPVMLADVVGRVERVF